MPVKLLTSGGGGVNLVPSSSIASDQTMYLPTSGTSGGTVLCTDSSGGTANGVLYLNSSKQVTSGSGLVFDSSGNLLVGTDKPNSTLGQGFNVYINGGSTQSFIGHLNGTTSGTYYTGYSYNGTLIGSITQSGTTGVAFNTSSDYRLKEDYQPVEDAIARLNQLKPINFKWKSEDRRCDGFLAHELQEVIPEAATGTKDETKIEEYEVTPAIKDEEGNVITEAVMGEREVPVYQGIDQSKIVPLLTAALQEAVAKIESLTQRIEALEYTKQGE